MSNTNDGHEEVRTGPLSKAEILNVRHIINDYFYRKRIRRMLKVWVYTIGTVATTTIGIMTVWKELISRLWK